MNPCRLRACGALVESLACHPERVSLPKRSIQQETLNVAPHLIYIYGLVADEPPYSHTQHECFASLQELYDKLLLKKETKGRFRLSPSMRPSAADLVRIQHDLSTKMNELEHLAEQNEQELLAQAANENKTKVHNKATKKPPRKPKQPKDNRADSEERTPQKTETLQQVLAQIQVPQYETEESSAWVEVGKKKDKHTSDPNTTIDHRPKDKDDENQTHDNKIRKNGVDSSLTDSGNVEMTWVENEHMAQESEQALHAKHLEGTPDEANEEVTGKSKSATLEISKNACTPEARMLEETIKDEASMAAPTTPLAAPAGCEPPTVAQSAMERLELRVQELEEALATSEEQRLEQQQQHAREMSKEREQSEERVQALQLRLYISETRLKTYEDALAAHINAVATNVAGGGSTSPDRPLKSDTLTTLEGSPIGKRPWVSKHSALGAT